ncbi:sulfate transporter CysZ [Alkalimarinus sediminis]|uniref:Sulfate transporter CysZ n=1 Tax=Alkalimarinus sediminis TaxID=1632866 RepID=A0A9E8KPX1_9ALTE|nr:sulfate transporter CysZ [Alkalimarinus sediminis]UZW73987.1 sulfate transporter CysZ [Alkalimarinus sediminis]
MKNQSITQLNLSGGLDYFSEGFRLIKQPGLRLFVIAPLIINTLLFFWMVTASYELFGGWMAALMEWLPSWLSFLEWLFWPLYAIAIIMILAYCFVAVANLIGSPFYGLLAEKVERQLTGETQQGEDDWKALLASIPRSIARELHKLMYYLPRALLLLVLGVIPGVNLVAGVLWFGFSSWMMTLQYVDYAADNNHKSFAQLKQFAAERRWPSLSFGMLVYAVAMIPLVNLIAVPAAVCGATAFWVNEKQRALS